MIESQNFPEKKFDEYVLLINSLLKKRALVYPLRDHSYKELLVKFEELTEFLKESIDNRNNVDIQTCPRPISEQFIHNPVFIGGEMKSGTSLLQQLLDNPLINVCIPGDSHLANNYLRNKNTKGTQSSFLTQKLINPSGKEPFWYLEPRYDNWLATYRQAHAFELNGYNPYESIILSIAQNNKLLQHENSFWIEKTPHNEFYADVLLMKYKHAKFLHVIRHPMTNLASLKKLTRIRNRKFRSWVYSAKLRDSATLATTNLERWGSERYKVVYYEDIINTPKETMIDVCKFLKVPFEQIYLSPTEKGIEGTANSMYESDRTVGKIANNGINERWKTELSGVELFTSRSILSTVDILDRYHFTDNSRLYKKAFNALRVLINLVLNLPWMKKRLALPTKDN